MWYNYNRLEVGNMPKAGYHCVNCKWEVLPVFDEIEKIYRCSDCGSEITGMEEGDENS
jgi:DNA-directed RNA polymerase subunit RPC12/RpoP